MARTLGKRVLVVHLIALGVVTLALGFLVNWLYPLLELTPAARYGGGHAEHAGPVEVAGATLLGLLMLSSLWRKLFRRP